MTLLVTGATGFVGARIAALGRARGLAVRASVRMPGGAVPPGVEAVTVGEIGPGTDWRGALAGVTAVVHAAANVHQAAANEEDAELHNRVNHLGTAALVRAAAGAGVARFVLISTVKVLGEGTRGRPLTDDHPLDPQDAYAHSKWLAEEALFETANETGMSAAVLRPPLVYGPGVKANFAALMALAVRGWPLPLGGLDNRRSLVHVDNLADAAVMLAATPAAKGRFLIADGPAVSTSELIAELRRAAGLAPRLFAAPRPLLAALAGFAGRSAAFDRLTGDLEIDDAGLRMATGWTPLVRFEDGIAATMRWYLEHGRTEAQP